MAPTRAPSGDLTTYARSSFTHGGATHDVYRKGTGPAVLIVAEIPGITPMVLGFADRVVALGCTVVVPHLFGRPGVDPAAMSKAKAGRVTIGTLLGACVSRDFTVLALGRSSRAVDWLRALARAEHAACGGPGVGVVGMCFTGGFALAMAADPVVLAPVLSQPSLPFGVSKKHRAAVDTSDADLDAVAGRCAAEGLRVLGLRFVGDPMVPAERFEALRRRLGDGFVAVELRPEDGHPDSHLSTPHSVLTGDLVDEPGSPTRAALDQVLDLLRSRLLD